MRKKTVSKNLKYDYIKNNLKYFFQSFIIILSVFISFFIEDIRKSLEGGVTLSKCFEKYPKIFDNIYINLIKAGEASGKLDVFLLKLVDSLEKREKVKKKIKSALTYPVVMFVVAITVMVFMLIKVVPIFAEMYEGMGVALPTPTAVIMNASNFMRGSGGLTLAIVLIIAFIAAPSSFIFIICIY